MQKRTKFTIYIILVIFLTVIIYLVLFKGFTDPLASEYHEMSTRFDLKYNTFDEAVGALKNITGTTKVFPDRIDFYVPGKIPREDGNPYFIFRSVVDMGKNDCLVGHMNLVSGEVESHHDVCIIYN